MRHNLLSGTKYLVRGFTQYQVSIRFPDRLLTSHMVASYSPHREGGGTLHFPSPTHCHNVDPLAALSHLRRSLSRSPSRGPTFRLVTSKSTSPSPSSPLSPSPLSSHNRLSSANILSNSPSVPASPLAIPYPPSAKKSRPNRRLSPMRMSPRSLIAPRSPARRVLHESPNNGNSTPPSSMGLTLGVENQDCQNFGMVERSEQQMQSKSGNSHSEGFLAPIHARNRRDRNSGYFADITAKSSPLKRSDGVMNLDMSPSGSPSAKRRSLHGASFGADFNIFDYASTFEQPQSDKSPTDSPAPDASVQFDSPGAQSPLPRRTSSLRRTTLQQRYDKPTANKTRANHDFALDMQSPAHGSSRNRQRMSLNNVFPTPNRDSPFSSQGLPSASVHPMSTTRRETMVLAPPLLPQRHPLSRTITQSSSGSSLAEDSPTHVPFRNPEFKRPLVDFSKSLPIGALRPSFNDPSSSEASQASSFATPDNYKLAKPLPTAFMSTGLISKRNKNLDDNQMDFNESVGHMPDTPCKRPVSMASIGAIPTPEVNFNKSRQGRHTMHSFGTPSTPFNPQSSHPSVGGLGKGVSIFGSGFGVGTHSRRGSFLSVDGDDNSQSPSNKIQSQSSAEFEIPPTPTKQVPSTPLVQHSDGFGQGGPLSSPYIAANDETEREVSSNTPACKYTLCQSPGGAVEDGGISAMETTPSATLRFRSLNAISSFSNRFSSIGEPNSPTRLPRGSLTLPALRVRNIKAKPSPLSPASPLYERYDRRSPHTPSESMVPPDPSGLSISARAESVLVPLNDTVARASLFPPATPTANRDSFGRFSNRRLSVTPVHTAPVDVDTTITARFDKFEIIGTGEFSHVYRVSRKAEPTTSQGYFSVQGTRSSPRTPLPDQVWAVKKSRNPYIGPRDRKQKLKEVEILKALGHSDHTINIADSWENNDHLYIQTEYCEEGSLDRFLNNVGRDARLDDFRIWKILLELSLVSNYPTQSG